MENAANGKRRSDFPLRPRGRLSLFPLLLSRSIHKGLRCLPAIRVSPSRLQNKILEFPQLESERKKATIEEKLSSVCQATSFVHIGYTLMMVINGIFSRWTVVPFLSDSTVLPEKSDR